MSFLYSLTTFFLRDEDMQLLLAEALLPHKEQSPSDILSPAAFPKLQHQASLPCCCFITLALSQWKARQQAGVTSSMLKAGSSSPGPPAPQPSPGLSPYSLTSLLPALLNSLVSKIVEGKEEKGHPHPLR